MSPSRTVEVNAWLVILFSTIVMVIFFSTSYNPPKPVVLVQSQQEKPVRYSRNIENLAIDPRSVTKEAQDPEIHDSKLQAEYYAEQICQTYSNVDPDLVKAVIFVESRFNPNAVNGTHVGLMQLSTVWQRERAQRLGVTDFYDVYSNILVGTCFISELLEETNGDVSWTLMIYNGGYDYARRYHEQGVVTSYVKMVLEKQQEYKEGNYAAA